MWLKQKKTCDKSNRPVHCSNGEKFTQKLLCIIIYSIFYCTINKTITINNRGTCNCIPWHYKQGANIQHKEQYVGIKKAVLKDFFIT